MTYYAWVLMFYLGGVNAGGPTVVDNIATEEECLKLAEQLPEPFSFPTKKTVCVKVLKVK